MLQIHEYSVDRARNIAVRGKTNPVRKFINDDTAYIVQLSDGVLHFYDQGGQTIDVDDLPKDILSALKKNPIRRGNETIEQVLKFCPFCPTDANSVASSDYEAHLIAHAQAFSAKAKDEAPAPKKAK